MLSTQIVFALLAILVLGSLVYAAGAQEDIRPQSTFRMKATKDLFGGSVPWNSSDWVAVDDRVRGGKSQSYLEVKATDEGARFHGILDIDTLGGAGFASQRTNSETTTWDLSAYTTLLLTVHSGDNKNYALNLRNRISPRRPDGGRDSSVEYKFQFSALGTQLVYADFRLFRPYYRGRPAVNASLLDTANIRSFDLMIASGFGQQEGKFGLTVVKIQAVE